VEYQALPPDFIVALKHLYFDGLEFELEVHTMHFRYERELKYNNAVAFT